MRVVVDMESSLTVLASKNAPTSLPPLSVGHEPEIEVMSYSAVMAPCRPRFKIFIVPLTNPRWETAACPNISQTALLGGKLQLQKS